MELKSLSSSLKIVAQCIPEIKREFRMESTSNVQVDEEAREAEKWSQQIQRIIDENRGKAGALIRVLEQVQGLVGYLPPPVLKIISRGLKVQLSEVYGIVSFYHFFTMVPRGKYTIQVCMGTACYVRGGEAVLDALCKGFGIEAGETTPDLKFSLETVRCLGCCGLSPVVAIDGKVYRRMTPTKIMNVLSLYE
jgi:NADH:ubiquinone oxidoreductase subunit E